MRNNVQNPSQENVASSRPFSTSHTFIVLSQEAEATHQPIPAQYYVPNTVCVLLHGV